MPTYSFLQYEENRDRHYRSQRFHHASRLLDKISRLSGQVQEAAVVMSANARQVWETELGT